MWGLYSFHFLEAAEGILLSNVVIGISMLVELKHFINVCEGIKKVT